MPAELTVTSQRAAPPPLARSGQYSRYGQRKQFDFFVQHLLGIKPPDWNASTGKPTTTSQQ